jgi:hypothetical protein
MARDLDERASAGNTSCCQLLPALSSCRISLADGKMLEVNVHDLLAALRVFLVVRAPAQGAG